MFAVLIGQIEHLDSSSIRSYCVGQVYVTNEIIQFNEQKLIDKIRCEWCFNSIPPANSMCFWVCSIFFCFSSVYHTNTDHRQMLLASRLLITPTLIVCLPHQYEVWYVMQPLVRLSHHIGEITWFRYRSIGIKCLSQGHNDTLPDLGTETEAYNLAIAYLHSYPLSCTATS